jgi:NAD(P)-dependent dehydrogenase (short-subunit alcohol dehydrogenase family)
MNLGLDGKVVVITGATRGIGRAIALTLAAEGCRIVFCARKPEEIEEATEAFRSAGVDCRGFTADVADAESYGAFLTQAPRVFGQVDAFVPNVSAGGGMGSEQFWRNSFEIDVLGTVRGCEALAPIMAEGGGGAVVLISTTAAQESFVGPMAYNAMKAALLNYAKNLSQQYAARQVRVNAVAPGPVYFEGGAWAQREAQAPSVFQSVLSQIPMGRMASPQDVANAVAYLASPAAAYVTGVTLTVDGGFTKRVDF